MTDVIIVKARVRKLEVDLFGAFIDEIVDLLGLEQVANG